METMIGLRKDEVMEVKPLQIVSWVTCCVLAAYIYPSYGLAPSFVMEKIGALRGGSCVAHAVIGGQVVGSSGEPQDENKAFIWAAGKLTPLGFLPGGDYSSGQAISRNG